MSLSKSCFLIDLNTTFFKILFVTYVLYMYYTIDKENNKCD